MIREGSILRGALGVSRILQSELQEIDFDGRQFLGSFFLKILIEG
jgi:hypothetical protein